MTGPAARRQTIAPLCDTDAVSRPFRPINGSAVSRRALSLVAAGTLATLLLVPSAAMANVDPQATDVTSALIVRPYAPVDTSGLATVSAPVEQSSRFAIEMPHHGPRALPEGTSLESDFVEVRAGSTAFSYQVARGDNLSTLAARFGVDANSLAQQNQLSNQRQLQVGQTLQVDAGVRLVRYTVQAGDTLPAIGAARGVDWQYLARLNNLLKPASIQPGQILLVPHFNTIQEEQQARTLTQAASKSSEPSVSKTRTGPLKTAKFPAAPRQSPPANAPGSQEEKPATAPSRRNPVETQMTARASQATDRTSPTSRSGRSAGAWQDDFLAAAAAAARHSQSITGVPASVTIAQAILESDWGRATVGANNFFGIKAETKPGPAGVVWAATKEYTDKGWITIQAPFRAYENMAQSFVDHGKFFLENSRYGEAMRNAADPKAFARLIQSAGYATDPVYAKSLIGLMDQYDLYQHDQPSSEAMPLTSNPPAPSGESGSGTPSAAEQSSAADEDAPTADVAAVAPVPSDPPALTTPSPAQSAAEPRASNTSLGAFDAEAKTSPDQPIQVQQSSTSIGGESGLAVAVENMLIQGADLLKKMRP